MGNCSVGGGGVLETLCFLDMQIDVSALSGPQSLINVKEMTRLTWFHVFFVAFNTASTQLSLTAG